MRKLRILGLLLTVLIISVPAFSAEFPLREKYPDVTPISIADLAIEYDTTIVIDVRSTWHM